MAEKQDDEKLVEEAKEAVQQIETKLIGVMPSRGDTEHAVKRFVKDLSKAPAPKQICVGAGAGWLAGYVTMKVGKMAATAIGGSLLLLQIAHHKGYIKVDWNKMSEDSSSMAQQVKNQLRLRSKSSMEKIGDFASENIYIAGGFTGGFFLGIASS